MYQKPVVNARKSQPRQWHIVDRENCALLGAGLVTFTVMSNLFGPAFWRDSQCAPMPPHWPIRDAQNGTRCFGLGTVLAAVVRPTLSRIHRFLRKLTLAGQLIILFTFLLGKIVLRCPPIWDSRKRARRCSGAAKAE